MDEQLQQLEAIANELMQVFEIAAPPVPVETMLQKPRNNMWDEVDVTQLSGGFLSLKDRYSPRMSMARLLARHVASSTWGKDRGLFDMFRENEHLLHAFARMLIMPEEMMQGLSTSALGPTAMSLRFEVPEDDAKLRLQEFI